MLRPRRSAPWGLSGERFKTYRAGAAPVVDGGADAPVLAVFTERGFQNMTNPAKKVKMLDDLFHDTLKEDLKAAFEKHAGETEGQIDRLEQVFGMIDEKPQGKNCPAIVGLIEEGKEIMKEYRGSPALDAGLLSGAQAVEHYEMSRYGTLRTWAEELGLSQAAKLLQATLNEEEKTDKTLTQLAEVVVNQEAEAA